MKTFAWLGTQPVSSSREITNLSPYILIAEDGCYITFSRDRSSTNPYDLTFDLGDAHKFFTIEKAVLALRGLHQLGEKCTIHSL